MISIFNFLHSLPADLILAFQLIFSWLFLWILADRYKSTGIICFIVISIIAANIQVLKFGQFIWMNEPVALGTIPFAATFLATDILSEFYGSKQSIRAVHLGFMGFAFFILTMLLTLGIPPLPWSIQQLYHIEDAHGPMMQIFTPMPSIFIASIIAYFLSQYTDVYVYKYIKRVTGEKLLWIRSLGAASLGAFVDTAVFSLFAWRLLADNPVSWQVLWTTYILGSFWPRIIVSATGIPILYILRKGKESLSSRTLRG